MLFGTIKTVNDQNTGVIVGDDGKECAIALAQGKTFIAKGIDPTMVDCPSGRRPKAGDRVAYYANFSHSEILDWGFYDEYAKAGLECRPLCDANLAKKYPYIAEVLRRTRRRDDSGGFSVRTEELGLETLNAVGHDHFTRGEQTQYCAVVTIPKGEQRIILLKMESWWPDGMDEGFTPADRNIDQLYKLDIGIDQIVALVMIETPVDTEMRVARGQVLPRRAKYRCATIYLM